ncbi:integral to membrane [Pyrrhoderma noxium]|uniref:Glycerophosphocholine acyltransferase 1 n=1 Tax=Pyrrhoderma noxium TaxID=2282107 RepID=A0A286UNM6_9AGAM|nr:integral to membrane [Pyrrhoderma noxium]
MSVDSSNENSRPPSPTARRTSKHRSGNSMGFFSVPFERFNRDEISEWSSAFTLLDTIETFFDSRMDLLERQLKKHSERLKTRAEEAFKLKTPSGDIFAAKDLEREVQKFKLKVSSRMASLSTAWQSAKVVRTREKISFFFGVMSLLFTSLMFGMAPEWLHISYTVQAFYLLPLRAYQYKKRAWHYFLFDLCYYTTILNLVYIWFLPSSTLLWVACYCMSHGSLASAVITWRNSLVFHDTDKVTSLFVHIYAPLVFTVIRHYYPNVDSRFPAVNKVPYLAPLKTLGLSALIYVSWQALYWKFVLVDRRKKIESGERTTSFSWMLNDKRGVIGRMLSRIPRQYRELSFMSGQLVYTLVVEIPVFITYRSRFWSAAYLLFIFSVSVWNGGGFYIEVFGRKFERELEALRKELAESSASRSGIATPSRGLSSHSRSGSEDNLSTGTVGTESPVYVPRDLPATELAPTPLNELSSSSGENSNQSLSSQDETKKDR